MDSAHPQSDCIVVGASFAGLACASALARAGMRVTVLERKSDPGEKLHTTEMVCWASGGPQKYSGRSMADFHRHLNITSKEWDAFMDDFRQTMDKFKVPAAERGELKAIVDSTYGDIVIGKA
jgi:hemoglobin